MPRPVRLQLSRRRGFNLQAVSRAANGLVAKVVTRATKWGNPWKIEHVAGAKARGRPDHRVVYDGEAVMQGTEAEARQFAFARHRGTARKRTKEIRAELAGFNLACTCGPDELCHADTLLEIANPSV